MRLRMMRSGSTVMTSDDVMGIDVWGVVRGRGGAAGFGVSLVVDETSFPAKMEPITTSHVITVVDHDHHHHHNVRHDVRHDA